MSAIFDIYLTFFFKSSNWLIEVLYYNELIRHPNSLNMIYIYVYIIES